MIRRFLIAAIIILAFLFLAPLVYIGMGSITDATEMASYLGPVLGTEDGYASWTLLPQLSTLHNYIQLLLETPDFFVMFWNSVRIAAVVLAGQLIVGAPAAWAFSQFRFKGKSVLFFVYVLLMMMPFQVTMLSTYVSLDALNLLNTQWAVMLPAAFSTFPVFIMYCFFKDVPRDLLDAARIDGASEWMIFWRIGLPLGSLGIAAALILSFLEVWNMIEQPLVFLSDKSLWPLSLYYPEATLSNVGIVFAASVVALVPPLLLFLAGRRQLEEGIVAIATGGGDDE